MIFGRLAVLLCLVFVGAAMGQVPLSQLGWLGKFWAASFFITAPLLYFLPTIEGYWRRQPNVTSIALVNTFLGWTLVGWVVSIAWACKSQEMDSTVRETAPDAGVPSKPLSFADELTKLAALKDRGLLTDEEFAQQKSKLLA